MSVFALWRRLLLFLLSIILTYPALAATPGKRIALVIGNSAYKNAPLLANPTNDAEDVAKTLSGLGFQVTKSLDLNKTDMDRALSSFASSLKGAEVGLFFYAGHGMQVSGQNYLVPVDAKLESPSALDFETVRLDVVQRIMENETLTNVLILDACRDNPLTRNLARAMGTRSGAIGKGLAAQESGAGTIISYSTQPDNVALDGLGGRNSPFAVALVKHLPSEGTSLSSILVKVRNDVMAATAKRQVPWEHSALTNELVLAAQTRVLAPKLKEVDETSNRSAGETVLPPSTTQLKLPLDKLVHELNGTMRFFVSTVYTSTQVCQFRFARSDSPKMSTEQLQSGEYFDFKAGDTTYRGMLLGVTDEHCTLEVAPMPDGKAATKDGGLN